MNRERLYLFDTTLRDGAQTTGVDFSLEDKRQIAAMLDELGVDYVEGGYPGANPLDTRFFETKPTRRARFCAFGMTKRARPLGGERSRPRRPHRRRRGRDRVSSPRPGTITFVSRSAARWRRTSPPSRTA